MTVSLIREESVGVDSGVRVESIIERNAEVSIDSISLITEGITASKIVSVVTSKTALKIISKSSGIVKASHASIIDSSSKGFIILVRRVSDIVVRRDNIIRNWISP
jgi:hypothetical protein